MTPKKNKPIYWKQKPWYWCDESTGGKCNGKWRCHKPSECRGKDFKPGQQIDWKKKKYDGKGDKRDGPKSGGPKDVKKLKLAKAMQAISGATSDDTDSTT